MACYRTKPHVNHPKDDRPAPSYTLFRIRLSAEQQYGPWTFGQGVWTEDLVDRKHVDSIIVGESNTRCCETGPARSLPAGVSATHRL